MFKQELKNETISLGAIYQACNEIKKIAWQGEINISIIEPLINSVYQKCVASFDFQEDTPPNHVKEIYAPFTDDLISKKIGQILKSEGIKAEVEVLFQKIGDLHKACPKNLGDWYFSGDYPTLGGHRVVNRAFMNFYEGKSVRAY